MGQSNGEHNQFAEIHFLSGRTSTVPAYRRVRKRSFCNKKDISIPKKYRELIVMAVGIATSTETTMKVHGKLALENGATIDEIFEVIRILFFTCGVTKLLPALETLGDLFEAIDLEEK